MICPDIQSVRLFSVFSFPIGPPFSANGRWGSRGRGNASGLEGDGDVRVYMGGIDPELLAQFKAEFPKLSLPDTRKGRLIMFHHWLSLAANLLSLYSC